MPSGRAAPRHPGEHVLGGVEERRGPASVQDRPKAASFGLSPCRLPIAQASAGLPGCAWVGCVDMAACSAEGSAMLTSTQCLAKAAEMDGQAALCFDATACAGYTETARGWRVAAALAARQEAYDEARLTGS